MAAALLALSLVVMLNVFWSLRQPGLTLAGDAACGILEHTHDETCGVQVCICDLSEESPEISAYLRGDVLNWEKKGWHLVTVDGFSIGWGKGDGSVLKNHYPKGLRNLR
jgi:hypothetical protein